MIRIESNGETEMNGTVVELCADIAVVTNTLLENCIHEREKLAVSLSLLEALTNKESGVSYSTAMAMRKAIQMYVDTFPRKAGGEYAM